MNDLYLAHHGILGQKWGKRNGPPYPLKGGSYSVSEKRQIYEKRKQRNSIYNKKHFDEVLSKDTTTLHTLSYNRDRTKDTDMFYASHDYFDMHQYNALFNKPAPREIFDENGNSLGTGQFLKYRIDNALSEDIKVASEDSGAKIFMELYSKDRDFYNFVTDSDRMQEYFVKEKYGFKGYREGRDVLVKMQTDSSYTPSDKDLTKVYRLFNYVIPYDGAGSQRRGNDMAKQRAKFFKACKDAGYGAVLDTNDAIYGRYKAKSPVIVFDMEKIVPKDVYQTKTTDKYYSDAVLAFRKTFKL